MRRADAGRLFGWVAYTLSWSQRYDDTGVLGRSDWDERHILNLVSGYRIGRATTVGFGPRFLHSTGHPPRIEGVAGERLRPDCNRPP